jgi:DNA-binding MarR family transcriptional regulator
MARLIYRLRRRRDDLLGSASLFSDPAWDMLLDLFIAAREEKPISISGVGAGSGVPATTALRYVTALQSAGLITLLADPADRRRQWVHLAPACEMTLHQLLSEAHAELQAS